MRIASQLFNGLVYEAQLVSIGEGRLLQLQDEEYLSPADATFGEFGILEATPAERAALRDAGYDLPDYTEPEPGTEEPEPPPCGGAPGEIMH
jgi:hypothetical protein